MTTSVEEQVDALRASAAQPGADIQGIANQLHALSAQTPGLSDAVAAQQACVDVLTSFDSLVATDGTHRTRLADEQANLAVRLIAAGDDDAAVAAGRQAITTYREAGALPGLLAGGIEDLARNLTILDKQLFGIGDQADALDAQQAAVDLLRTPRADDPDAARAELLALALSTLAARFIGLQRTADAAAPTSESTATFAAVLRTLRGGLIACAVRLTDLVRDLTAAGQPDIAEQARAAAAAALSGDAAALPGIAAGSAPDSPAALAAAEVIRARGLLTRVSSDLGELDILARQSTGAGLTSEAQDALAVRNFAAGLSATGIASYCAVAGPGTPSDLPQQSFGPLRGQWPRKNLSVSIRTENAPAPVAPMARDKIMDAIETWNSAAQAVTGGFLTLQVQPDETVGTDLAVFFADDSLVVGFTADAQLTAYAGFPGEAFAGRVILNSKHQWAAAELEAVTLHELGHALGFTDSHTTVTHVPAATGDDAPVSTAPVSTMFPASANLTIDSETLSVLRAAYGWTAQNPLRDRGTEHRPSLGVRIEAGDETPKMVWKGIGEATIWESDLAGGQWSPQHDTHAGLTSHRPVLARVTDPAVGLIMAWREPDEGRLRWALSTTATPDADGRPAWGPSEGPVPGAATTDGPALANFAGMVWMAWTGRQGDPGLYWAVYDQAADSWSAQQRVTAGPGGGPVAATDSPALVGLQDSLVVFWRGAAPDDTIWVSSMKLADASSNTWQVQQKIVSAPFSGPGVPVGAASGPSATLRHDADIERLTGAPTETILLSWRGPGSDQSIYLSEIDRTEVGGATQFMMSGQVNVPGRSTQTGPAVAEALGGTLMAWKGRDSDTAIYWSML